MKTLILILLLLCLSFISSAEMTEEVLQLQKQWAVINYQTQEDEKEQAFEKLAKTATQTVINKTNDAQALVWEGIIYSTYAGVAGTFSAGKLAKHAKKSFEEAIRIDGDVLQGSAYTSLGVLYYKVPGWPLSFGNDKKAQKLLLKGLQLNPEGIDSNYFYAEYLYDEADNYVLAKEYISKAETAKPRQNRPLADQGRQAEIKILKEKINKKL